MTLTEFRYIVALAQTRHFGRAAERCYVSQPTLSVGVKKLEEELGVVLFERGGSEVTLTPVGETVVEQAQRILEETDRLKQLAQQGRDPLAGPLRLGVIFTIAPYLLPLLVTGLKQRAPHMPLFIQENYTVRLLESLRRGELDCIVLALPFDETGLDITPLYDEPFRVVLPDNHPWCQDSTIPTDRLAEETVMLLSTGNCFRDQVLAACPALIQPLRGNSQIRTLEGSSLSTIRFMVASGVGISVMPASAALQEGGLPSRPLVDPEPSRRVVIATRRRFNRPEVIAAIQHTLLAAPLPGTQVIASTRAPLAANG